MSDYSVEIEELVRKTRSREDALGLIDETCRSRFLLQSHPTAKVILFFHGFTAAPEQFVPIGEAFFNAGYNVLIPLLPGHGQAGDWNDDNPPPLPENPLLYQSFGLKWLQQAQALGDRVVIGGLSGGSTLSAWLALERPQQIDRSLLFAPYLSSTNRMVDWVVERFNIYFEWKAAPNTTNFGYKGFSMPALRVLLDMGQDILDRAKTQPAAPMLVVSSESDQAVGDEEHRELFESALKLQPKCWYHRFDKQLNIQHNMMTKAEGNEYQDLVIALARAYVGNDLTWDEFVQVRDRLTQSQQIDQTIAQLESDQRLSPSFFELMKWFSLSQVGQKENHF